MNPIKSKLKIEQELTENYLKDMPHAFFTMKGHDMLLEKGQNLAPGTPVWKETDFRALVAENSSAEVERFYRSLNVSGHYQLALQITLDDGKTYNWFELRYRVGMNTKGEIETEGLLINIERNLLKDKDIENARNQEMEARSKEMFLKNLSTEIRSPLNIILGFSELLSNPDFSFSEEERQNYCQVIHGNSRVLMTLVNEILDLSRIESGRLQFSMKECFCEDLLEPIALNWMQQMPEGVNFKFCEGRAGIPILADKSRLEQILNEFLSNAVKYTSQGQIEMGWQYSLATRKVEIYVEDTGCGMPEERRLNLLDPTHGMDKMENGMNHLGLAICQVIAKSMNLEIDIQSQEGRGTRLSLFLKEAENA